LDHYATLGVSRTSEDVVIKAAYLALMRRYHPDANSTSEAAQRARDITTAYETLGDAEKRREYDRGWDFTSGGDATFKVRRRAGPVAFGVTLLCLALIIWLIQNQSRPLANADFGGSTAKSAAEDGLPSQISCLAPEVKELVRQELLRKAGQLRSGKGSSLAALAGMDVRTSPALTMSRPSPDSVECSADITVPTPLEQAGGDERPAISGIVDFLVSRQRGGALSLIQFAVDDRFLVEMASLGQTPRLKSSASGEELADLAVNESPDPAERAHEKAAFKPTTIGPANPTPVARFAQNTRPMTPAPSRPTKVTVVRARTASCDSGTNKTGSCNPANLKALATQLSIFEQQSLGHADSKKRDALRIGRSQYELDRKECRTPACSRDVMLRRTREIADIVRGRAPEPSRRTGN
jgi:hypothetical protein